MNAYTSAAKWICLLLVVSLFMTGMPISVNSAADDGTTVNGTVCYGYTTLNEAQQSVYRKIHAAVRSSTPDTPADIDKDYLTPSELKMVVSVYVSDHPEMFWFIGTIVMGARVGASTVSVVYPIFELNGKHFTSIYYDANGVQVPELLSLDVLEQAKRNFNEKVSTVMTEMSVELGAGATDEQRSLWLHDKVAEIITYESTNNDQTAYGALVEEKAVCAGYTALYQHLLQMTGVQSFRITGVSFKWVAELNQYVEESHAWNLVSFGDVCVYTDVTWDDSGDSNETAYHLYYARSYSDIYKDHREYVVPYEGRLPLCSDACECYYLKNDKVIPGIATPRAVAAKAILSADGKSFTARMMDTDDSLYGWDTPENMRTLGAILGITGDFSYSWKMLTGALGTELHLTMTFSDKMDPGREMKGSIHLGGISSDALVSIELIPQNFSSAIYGVQVAACNSDYILRNLPAGNYTVRVSAPKHVTREYTVTIP